MYIITDMDMSRMTSIIIFKFFIWKKASDLFKYVYKFKHILKYFAATFIVFKYDEGIEGKKIKFDRIFNF